MVTTRFGKKIELCEPKSCSGCSACYSICPTHSISMVEDQWGETHPVINNSHCIHCKKCLSVCPNNNDGLFTDPFICYAAWRKSETKRANSSSGGIAAVLSEKCVQKGGIVYGVGYDRDTGINYKRLTELKSLEKLKGSKYVQASLGKVFQNINDDLLKGNTVLFIGSPCQVAGLETYVQHSACHQYRKNLITVDFLCHGTVPQKYFYEEILYLEEKNNIRADQIVFRSNDLNLNYYLTLFHGNKKAYSVKAEKQHYFYCFLHSITCRESCIGCPYKQKRRVGDITIGDFIGIGRKTPIDLPPGINPSVILVNSKHGENIISEIVEECIFIKRDIQEAVDGGPSLRGDNIISPQRRVFRKHYPGCGFHKAANQAVKGEMFINDIVSAFRSRYNIFHKIRHNIKGKK